MPCPMSTGSNWLDRLRSSKGLPISDQNLDHFLLNNPHPNTYNTLTAPPQNPAQLPDNQNLVGVITNVLSELFVMGDYANLPAKKSSRKQKSPKVCAFSKRPENVVRLKRKRGNLDQEQEVGNNNDDNGAEDEEGTCRMDLSGFSRGEVTVIDTSYECWKFEKMLFRRKNVWKVRDKKKGKGMVGSATSFRKRSKGCGLIGQACLGNVKKSKKLGSSLNEVLDQTDKLDSVEEACKEGPESISQLFKIRQQDTLKKGSSSIILTKNIPKSKKKFKSNPKRFQKSTERTRPVFQT